MDREPTKSLNATFVGMLPATRLPPDAATLKRIYELHTIVERPLTLCEILLCLTPEGTA